MRVVALDLSRTVADIAYLEEGQLTRGGRVTLLHAVLTEWAAAQLRPTDHVVLEATGNTMAVVQAVRSRVARVVVANPAQVRLIAEARVKTDKIDAAILAQLYASGFLPDVWIPDDATQTLRRQVGRRVQIVRQRVRLKNEVHGVLHTYLLPALSRGRSVWPQGASVAVEPALAAGRTPWGRATAAGAGPARRRPCGD